MSEIILNWTNKGFAVRACGSHDYKWVDPVSNLPCKARRALSLTDGHVGRDSNVLAIGDGLDVLEALAATTDVFAKGIRLVYIDPPFNTSADVECYSDTMDRSMWLGMLRDRLVALQQHLSDDASVWVHLDDSEVHRARLVMDEIFGDSAFVASIIWQKRTTRESRSAFSGNHDTILVYSPRGPKKWKASRNLLTKNAAALENRDNDPRGPWADAPFTAPGYRAAQQYPITTPSGNVLRPPLGRSWYATEQTFDELFQEGRIWFPKNGSGSPRIKMFSHHLRGLVPFTIWGSSETGTNDDAKRHLMALFPGQPVFDTPKPEQLLERIIHIATNEGDLVVDLFGGSGTTAAVAHKMRRRWVLAERGIETVVAFTLPRLQAVARGNDANGVTDAVGWSGGGDFEVVYAPPCLGEALSRGELSEIQILLKQPEFGVTGPSRVSQQPPSHTRA